jgi:hypothetical protein
LEQNEAAGNVWIDEVTLNEMAFKTVVIMEISAGIEDLLRNGRIERHKCERFRAGENGGFRVWWYALRASADAERSIARKVGLLVGDFDGKDEVSERGDNSFLENETNEVCENERKEVVFVTSEMI